MSLSSSAGEASQQNESSVAPVSSNIVWKTEGPTDMLALLSMRPHEGHQVTCNVFGAGENPLGRDNEKSWMFERFRGKIVYVIHDCDKPGQEGALQTVDGRGNRRLGWAHACALYADECRNVVLPYEITESHGKDLRDYLCERLDFHTAAGLDNETARRACYSDMLEMASQAEIIPNPDPDGVMVLGVAAPEELSEEENESEEENFVLEAVDDPYRLARINMELYRSSFGREIRNWNEDWYLWKAGQYVEITEKHFEARLNSAIKREFDRVWHKETEEYNAWKDSEKYDESRDKGPPVARKVVGSLVRNTLEATRAHCFMSSKIKMHSWLDGRSPDDDFVSVKNGILNLTKLMDDREIEEVLLPHDPNWFSISKLPYNFDLSQECPRWEEFLDQVFNSDEESITALQMWFGYLISTDMSLHKIMFIIGQTRSGKGTIVSVLRELLGEHSVGTPTLSSLGQQYGLVSLIGKTSAMITDARMPSKADESIITERLLNISGGDPVDIQRKYKTDLDNFMLSCRFTLFSNLLPRLKDASAVFVNRCIFLAMPNSYLGQEDTTIKSQLLREMSGILNWAIMGRKMLSKAKKISQPTSGYTLLNELQSILSPVSMFLSDRCVMEKEHETVTRELFSAWEEWCLENDISHPGDIQSFSRKLKANIPNLGTLQKRDSFGRTRFFIGIKIKE